MLDGRKDPSEGLWGWLHATSRARAADAWPVGTVLRGFSTNAEAIGGGDSEGARPGIMVTVTYADITTRERNRLKRWLQNRRLDDALVPLSVPTGSWSGRCLDFGGGDAALSRRVLERSPGASAVCYEPSESIRLEADAACASSGVRIVGKLAELSGPFDFITCCEVFEHLPPEESAQALHDLGRLVADSGRIVIGVPNEIFSVGLMKGLFRMTRRYGKYDAKWGTVLPAALGRPRQNRPVLALDGLNFIFPHTGFDYRRLRVQIREAGFRIQRQYGSPFRISWPAINSEVYLVLVKV